jgi:lipoate-protein ligase A
MAFLPDHGHCDPGVASFNRGDGAMNAVERELKFDLERLEAAQNGGAAEFRVWTTEETTVVVGRSVDIAEEVDVDACRGKNVPVVRRPSGGRSVVVGRGTLQYSFVLSYDLADELKSIRGSKLFCNRLLVAGLDRPGRIQEDESGDLTAGDRKFAGLALKRRKSAMLLHGTLLVGADLDLIATLLRHPVSEPPYRRGRNHSEFLTNIDPVDVRDLETRVRDLLLRAGQL